ncbi:MAG: hypothetical protein AAF799_34680 [Myxococcota bacterium]
MLRPLEDLIIPPIDAVMPVSVSVLRGPYVVAPPWPNSQRIISVYGRAIRTIEPTPSRDDDGPSFIINEETWDTDGIVDTFVLPPEATGSIFEVESPPGFPMRRGDDYLVDGDTIRFYRAPDVGAPGVLARLQAEATHGYTRRRPCIMELDIDIYGRFYEEVDLMLGASTQISLAAMARAPRFTFPPATDTTVLMRIIEARASVASLERAAITIDAAPVFHAAIRLEIDGQLDLVVANGRPVDTSLIESIEGTVEVVPADGEAPVPQTITIEPDEPVDP